MQTIWKNKLNRLHFTSMTFRKEISWKPEISWDYVSSTIVNLKSSKRHHGGREGGRQQVTICYQEITVYFSVAIDRDSVSPGIVRSLRDGWRTINCTSFITDKRSALSLCPTQVRTNLVVVRIRCVSVLHTHPHMYPRSSEPLDV